MTSTAQRRAQFEQLIVDCCTNHAIVETEQGRSFPLSTREAGYLATCLLATPVVPQCPTCRGTGWQQPRGDVMESCRHLAAPTLADILTRHENTWHTHGDQTVTETVEQHWDVWGIEHKTGDMPWRPTAHQDFATQTDAETRMRELEETASSSRLRVVRYVGCSSETRTVATPDTSTGSAIRGPQ